MKTIQKPTLDDIVFEHRHQAYGAYAIRKSYPNVLFKAVLAGSAFFVLLFLLPTIFAHLKPKAPLSVVEVNLQKYVPLIEQQPDPVVPPPVEKSPVKMVKNLIPEVKMDEKVTDETPPPTVEELKDALSGPQTIEGANEEPEIVAPLENAPPDAKADAVEVAPEIFSTGAVEIQPQFVGGMSELVRFISKHLRYPPRAAQANVQGSVYVQFVVMTDGTIADVQTLKGIGFGCDDEAMRVIKAMPKWRPGSQSGRPVRVRFNMPITFTLQE